MALIASTMAGSGVCVLTGRGTWRNFKNRADLGVLVEGDQRLFNQYGVRVLNPAKYPQVKVRRAEVRRLGDRHRSPAHACRRYDQWPATVLPKRRQVSRRMRALKNSVFLAASAGS